jgi:L-asparaginase/Glu-tRNA(Gln) amidotransferase subunit D
MGSGKYDGAIWTQNSSALEEASYWMNLLIDTPLPIACNSAQRPQGQISNDGPINIVDSVNYIHSRIWADREGCNRLGIVAIQDRQFFAAREVTKVDARAGGYIASGGHGGILGQFSHANVISLMYLPAYKHTHLSEPRSQRHERRWPLTKRYSTLIRLVAKMEFKIAPTSAMQLWSTRSEKCSPAAAQTGRILWST